MAINMRTIQQEIDDLERYGSTSYDTCNRLASLYAVRNQMQEQYNMDNGYGMPSERQDNRANMRVYSQNGGTDYNMRMNMGGSRNIGFSSETDFIKMLEKCDMNKVVQELDRYLTKVKTLHPKEYEMLMNNLYKCQM